MPEPKKYRSVYTDKEHRMYSNDPMRQRIAAKYDEPVIPIEEVVVTPKYRTLPQNRFFRRPGETEQQYYSRMATQESITPSFPEKEVIAAQLVGGLASKIAPRLGAMSAWEEKEMAKVLKEMEQRGIKPTAENFGKYLKSTMPKAEKVAMPEPSKYKKAINYMEVLNETLKKHYGGYYNPVPFVLRDENTESVDYVVNEIKKLLK